MYTDLLHSYAINDVTMMTTPNMTITAIKPTAYKRRSASIIKDGINIPTNLPEAKSGTKSTKKQDFWSKSGTQKKKKISRYIFFSFFVIKLWTN